MLFDEVKEQVVQKMHNVIREQREKNGSVYLHTDRYMRKIKGSYSLPELLGYISSAGYSWDWISPIFEDLLDLSRVDLLAFVHAISSSDQIISDIKCDLCGED